jgi:hypothetical protein
MLKYLQEQDEWDQFVLNSLGQNAVLVSVSRFSSDCRVYRTNDAIFKIRRLTPASMRGRNNFLEDEYLILQRLSSVTGVPAARSSKRRGEWEQLEMEPLPELYGIDQTFGSPSETFKDFWNVVRVTRQMNRLGCSHGDLHWSKVGRNVEGGISVFGFDQASVAAPWRCAVRDMLGFFRCGRRRGMSLLNRLPLMQGKAARFLRRVKARLIKELTKFLSKIVASSTPGPSSTQSIPLSKSISTQYVKLQADPALKTLAEAWSYASSKSSIGCYYSLDIGGINFFGVRPWILRWERFRKTCGFQKQASVGSWL